MQCKSYAVDMNLDPETLNKIKKLSQSRIMLSSDKIKEDDIIIPNYVIYQKVFSDATGLDINNSELKSEVEVPDKCRDNLKKLVKELS